MKISLVENLRIVWAITLKDLSDGFKNKNIISILISCLFIVVIYKYLPGLTAVDGPPALLVYDPAESSLLTALEDNPTVDLYTYDSLEDMQYYLTNGEKPELGLVIPDDFDDQLGTGSPVVLQAYALDIFKDAEVHALKRIMELEFENIISHPVLISVDRLQLQPETYGVTVLTGIGFVFVTLMVGMMVIPHMIIEEVQEKTLSALLVSPANRTHILAAKSLTGLIYTLGMLLVTVAFNWDLIQQRWLFLLGGLLGSLFAISLGILLGTTIDSRQKLTLWAWVVIIPLMIPMFLTLFDDLLPASLVLTFTWFPSSALLRVFRTSMAGTTPFPYYGPQLGILIASTAVFLAIDIWLIGHLERKLS